MHRKAVSHQPSLFIFVDFDPVFASCKWFAAQIIHRACWVLLHTHFVFLSSWTLVFRICVEAHSFNQSAASVFQDPGFTSPVFKEYHRTLIQERDRDMNADRSYDDDFNLFSCFSRLVVSAFFQKKPKTCQSVTSTGNVQSCHHRNPWLPGWILTATLVLSVLVLIWICCATVATAVDQYIPAEVCFMFSISGV